MSDIKVGCVVCGEEFKYGTTHKCDPQKLKRIEAGKKGAETKLEKYGTLTPIRKPNYDQQLQDGFNMLNQGLENENY